MKRFLFIMLIMSLTMLLVAGCGNNNTATTQNNPTSGMQVATLSGNSPGVIATPPAKDLGPLILLQDDFSDPASGWDVVEDEYGRAGYQDGGYLVESVIKNQYEWGVSGNEFENVRIDVDMTMLTAPESGDNAFGVDCRIQPNGDGYGFRISSDGYYTVSKYVDSDAVPLMDWLESDVILDGNQANHMTAICQGNHLSLLVNGVSLAEVVDDTFSSGDIALSVTSFEETSSSVLFDDIVVLDVGNPFLYEDPDTTTMMIENFTSKDACYVYVTSSAGSTWGFDLLGEEEIILPGETKEIGYLPTGLLDIKVETCDFLRLIEIYEFDPSETGMVQLIEPELIQTKDFTDDSGWFSGVVDGGLISISNGDYYSIAATESGKTVIGRNDRKFTDVMLHTDATLVKTGTDNQGIYGPMCRINEKGEGILFAVRGDGKVAIIKVFGGLSTPLSDWVSSEFVYGGVDSNYIEGSCDGENFTMFVNGDYIDSVVDNTFNSGYVGLAVVSPPGPTTQADFDFLNIYQPLK